MQRLINFHRLGTNQGLILVPLRVLRTKHHHFSGQSIVLGALEEIIIKRNALIEFLLSGLISADLSITRVGSTSAHEILS